MYMTRAGIVGVEETVLNPIVIEVSKDIQKMLGLQYEIPMAIGDKPALNIDKDHNQNTHIPDILDEELKVTYEETSAQDYDVALTSMVPTADYIYIDHDIHSYIKPILSRRTLTMSVSYYAKSKSKVSTMINRLRMLSSTDRRANYHNAEYHYYIPDIVVELLYNLNTLKNTHTIPPVDFDIYLGNTFSTQANVVNSHSGDSNKSDLAIRERQTGIIGSIDTDVYNLSKDEDSDTNRWFFTIEYVVDYDVPVQLQICYPIAVYNQPIPSKFMIENPVKSYTHGRRSLGEAGLVKTTNRGDPRLRIPDNCFYYRIPEEDNLTLPAPSNGYVRLFSVFAIVDTISPNHLFYLDEIPGITFKPEILHLMRLEAPRMGTIPMSIFHIEIFNFDKKLYTHKVVVTPVTEVINGVPTDRILLTSDLPLDIKGNYRVVFNLLTNLDQIPTGPLDQLEKNVATVDNSTPTKFDVMNTILAVLDIDITKLNPQLHVTAETTSFQIAQHIKYDLWNRVFTKQVSTVITEMLVP